MGAGAGVKVECKDFTKVVKVKTPKGGKMFVQVYMGDTTLGAYYWSMKCNRPGFLIIEDAKEQLKDLFRVDNEFVSDVKSCDLDKAEFDIAYDSRIEFWIGGGYCRTKLEHGTAFDYDFKEGHKLGIEVTCPAKLKDGSRTELRGVWYPERMTFRASDQFVDMYEWCWANEDGNYILDTYEHDDFKDEGERTGFISSLFSDAWSDMEDTFNRDDYYGEYGFAVRSKSRKPFFRRRQRSNPLYDTWTVGKKTVWSFEKCPKCGSKDSERVITTSRTRGEYPYARESTHLHCRKCDAYWCTEETERMSCKKVVFNTRRKAVATYQMTNTGGIEVYEIDSRNEKVIWGYGDGKEHRSSIGHNREGRSYFTAGKTKVFLDECMRTDFGRGQR